MTIQELISLNSDYGDRPDQSIVVPDALVRTVEELQRAEDPNVQRAYRLLLTLTALPRGDSLTRLKRVFGPHPIFPSHAKQLTQRSLISSISQHSMGGMAGESATKILVVSRPVREYVRQISSDEDATQIDRQLTELFFGSEWRSGSINTSQMGRKLKKPHCDDHDIQNSSTLIYRNLRRAILSEDQYELASAVALSLSFIKILVKGDHFRSAASIGEDIHVLLSDQSGLEQEINQLQLEWASALRMTGCTKQAREILEDTDFSQFTKSQKQSAELDLALCYESLKDSAAASEAARRIIAIDKHGSRALQAKAILAEQLEDAQEQQVQLQKLLIQAKRQKSWTLVSNLLLTLARLARSRGEPDVELIREASLASIENKDYYNSARAIVQFASSRTATEDFSDADTSRLIAAYHYLYNERLFSLFEKCHAALWRVFEDKSDIHNLLRLFRRSSFLWRLNNLEAREKEYLEKLQGLRISSKTGLKGTTDRDVIYFLVRATVVLAETQNAALEKT